MRFRNEKVPEGINVSRHSPVADLLLLTAGLVLSVVILALLVIWSGSLLGRYMPVSWEIWLAGHFVTESEEPESESAAEIEAALQSLADRLSDNMTRVEGLPVVVHYLDSDQINAFATLGGNVVMARGILERLDSENALAMVVAHEIAHVVHRDPAAALSSGLLFQLVSAILLGQSGESLAGLVHGSSDLLTKGFSREAERAADEAALRALAATYGHVAGADEIFTVLKQAIELAGGSEPPAFLSTHPQHEDRIARIDEIARAEGWPTEGLLSPLPPALRDLIEAAE